MPSEERTVPREVWVSIAKNRQLGCVYFDGDDARSQSVFEDAPQPMTVHRYVHESAPIPVSAETMAALKKSVSALGVLEGFAVVEELKALEAHIARCVVSTEVQGE